MASAPNSNDVQNQANAYAHNSQTPGLNAVIDAWANWAYFLSGWAAAVYNQTLQTGNLIGEVSQ